MSLGGMFELMQSQLAQTWNPLMTMSLYTEIDIVMKTGGSSNIPLFTGMLARIFGKEKVKESNSFSSVVAGLAIKARM
jgi:molecular chaperone DnaK (HSP70)